MFILVYVLVIVLCVSVIISFRIIHFCLNVYIVFIIFFSFSCNDFSAPRYSKLIIFKFVWYFIDTVYFKKQIIIIIIVIMYYIIKITI